MAVGNNSRNTFSTSTNLIRGAQTGDGASWKRLVSLYSPLVYGWCRDSGLAAGDAADILQEVFMAVWRGRAGFTRDKPGQSFRGWLRVIARSKIADHFRDSAAHLVDAATQNFINELAAPEDSSTGIGCEQRRVRQLLDRALEAIRPDFEPATWRAFQLSALQERDTAEVAAELGMTAAAVRQAKYKVFRRLREELGEGGF
jgi:RNA polymerase sigma-70 factor (ECF subfamily)